MAELLRVDGAAMTPPAPRADELHDPRFKAGLEMLRRTGATSLSIRFQDDDTPVVWLVVASYPEDRHEVDAAFTPLRAILRLCERLVDGARCTHCRRPAGLDPDSLERMPLDELVCWYQYDPELATFRRGCEGDT